MTTKPHQELTDLTGLKVKDVIPYYVDLIINGPKSGGEIARINGLIIANWPKKALNTIKTKSWAIVRDSKNNSIKITL